MHADVVILGGGPAGLAAAIALRQRAIECLVIEAREPLIDKACGEGLMPDALSALSELGIQITEDDGYPFRGIRFIDQTCQVSANFPAGPGMGVRRTTLYQRMAVRAQDADAQILWKSHARLLDRNSIAVDGNRVSFQWLIGADGQSSAVRRWAGLDPVRTERLRYGFRRHYRIAPWSEYVEVHWGPRSQIYITPVSKDTVCVAFVTRNPTDSHRDFFESFPAVAHRLADAPVTSAQRGAVSATRMLKRIAAGRIALVGDASGSVDAVTGEGLAISFRQAIALAQAIGNGNLKNYSHAHKGIGRRPHAMSEVLLTMDRWPAIERRAMSVLSLHPALFGQLLAVHVGAESLYRFALRQGPWLGWCLLRANS